MHDELSSGNDDEIIKIQKKISTNSEFIQEINKI